MAELGGSSIRPPAAGAVICQQRTRPASYAFCSVVTVHWTFLRDQIASDDHDDTDYRVDGERTKLLR